MLGHTHSPHIDLTLLWLLAAITMVTLLSQLPLANARNYRLDDEMRAHDERRATFSHNKKHKLKPKRSVKPNIVFVLTDDQDAELGSMAAMPKTRHLLGEAGAVFDHAYVTTPMCCPSRSSILTGMYVHNHNVYTNNDNCSSVQWREEYESRSFATYLSDAGYRTGYFGKYLNEYEGDYIPPGWTEWVGLIRNSRFYNYKLNFNGRKIAHTDNYYQDYLTDLIANDSVTFLKQSKQYFPIRPVAMVLSMPAPHGPEDSAPQYQHMFQNTSTHRTPAWNFAPNPDKQWILQYTGKMQPIHIHFTDMLQQKRLQTLQSVDDAVEKVYNELKELGELDNTYWLFSSDHGYHLGQFGMLKGKAMPYEFDIKVPFIMRGPGIPPGSRVPNIVLNVDIAPTLLDIAGIEAPPHMDGKSVLKLFDGLGAKSRGDLKKKKGWRDTFLVERGKITQKKIVQRERLEANKNRAPVLTKDARVDEACERSEYQPPCSLGQQWVCVRDATGTFRISKCRAGKQNDAGVFNMGDEPPGTRCRCLKDAMQGLDKHEMRLQKQFLKEHVSKRRPWKGPPDLVQNELPVPVNLTDDGTADPSSTEAEDEDEDDDVIQAKDIENPWNTPHEADLMKSDPGPQVIPDPHSHPPLTKYEGWKKPGGNVSLLPDVPRRHRLLRKKRRKVRRSAGYLNTDVGSSVACRVLPNNTVSCDEEPEKSFGEWKHRKLRMDRIIQEYKEQLDKLKTMRKHLKSRRPKGYSSGWGDGDGEDDDYDDDDSRGGYSTWRQDDYDDDDDDVYSREVSSWELAEDECDCEQLRDDDGFNTVKKEKKRKKDKGKKVNRREDVIKERQEKRDQKKKEREERRKEKDKEKNKVEIVPEVLPPSHGHGGLKEVTKSCNNPNMKCFEHNNDHWKTPPLWNLGPFCFCPNSNNNTYWCLRTINDTHNFLYCEFITGFISYYNIGEDPYQLRNAVFDLDYTTLQIHHATLEKLRDCRGARECTLRTRPAEEPGGPMTEEGSGESSGEVTMSGEVAVLADEVMVSGEVAVLADESPLSNIDVLNVLVEDDDCSGDVDDYDPRKEDFLELTRIFRLDYIDAT